jgi:hypothetical protein
MRLLRAMVCLVPVVALLASAFAPAPSGGLPLFSRQQSAPCTLCHSAFPRLNVVGLRFMQNGYRMPGVPVRSPWEAGNVPISISGNLGYAFASTDTADAATGNRGRMNVGDFRLGHLEFHSAGTLNARVSFHLASDLDTDAGTIAATTAFVQFDDVIRDGKLNVKAGIFDAGPPYLSSARRTTLRDYLSPVALDARGLELNGVRSGWTLGAGLIDSRRTLARLRPGTRTFNRLEDTYFWAMREVHGQQIGARMLFDRQDSDLPTLEWLQHLQAQGSALIGSGRFALIPAYTFDRFDDRPAAGIHDRHQYALLEALALLGRDQRWALTARLEHEYRTRTVLTREEDHDLEVLNLAYYFNLNMRTAIECGHAGDNIGGPRVATLDAFIHIAY